jgi:hypothetical protein
MLQRWLDSPVNGPPFSVQLERMGDGHGDVFEDFEVEDFPVGVALRTPSSLLFGVGGWIAEGKSEE